MWKRKWIKIRITSTRTSQAGRTDSETYHGEVGIHGVQLQVDLLVDALFGLGVVVLANLTHLVAFFGV